MSLPASQIDTAQIKTLMEKQISEIVQKEVREI